MKRIAWSILTPMLIFPAPEVEGRDQDEPATPAELRRVSSCGVWTPAQPRNQAARQASKLPEESAGAERPSGGAGWNEA